MKFEELKINEWFKFKDPQIPRDLLCPPSTPFRKVFVSFIIGFNQNQIGYTDYTISLPYIPSENENFEVVPVKNLDIPSDLC